MSDITLVLPFGLPPAELAPDLLRALELPALAMLLARADRAPGSAGADRSGDGYARALPHETWLAQRFGLDAPAGSSPAAAAALMAALKMPQVEGFWFNLDPVHFHVARDHLVLTDPRGLALSDTDAMALFTAALPSFEEAGLTLRYGRADCWFVRADGLRDLATSTPDAACGRNIDLWMPTGASARTWRKLQNIVQMDWHAHPVNLARAADGLLPVNTLWLWGGADAGAQPESRTDVALFGAAGWHAAFGALAGAANPDGDLQAVLAATKPQRIILRDDLTAPALAGDWSIWLDAMRSFENSLFAPLLAGLRQGTVDSLQLVLGNAEALHVWSVRRSSLRRFWRTASLASLRTEPLAMDLTA